MKLVCCWLCLLLPAGSVLCAADNTLTEREAQDGWLLLFDGESLFGWTPQGGAQWHSAGGEILAQSGDSGYLRSNSAFGDFVLHCDFRVRTDGESGIFLRISKDGKPPDTGYKLQINNKDSNFPTGSLVHHLKASGVQAAPNQWHSYEVEALGDRFAIRLDGKQVASGEARKSKAGHIGLQFVSGTPVEFRNIKLKPLSLQPIFNGQNLYEWNPLSPPPEAKKKSILKVIPLGGGKPAPNPLVQDRAIHFTKGPNPIETKAFYDDFILQLKIRADARNKKDHPSGGVYLRGEKGDGSTGYRVQIHNESSGGKPVENATGALHSIQNARRVVSADSEFFAETIVARGRHIAVWVNGYPVNDFEDTRAEGPDALIQARTVPGTIRLDADDTASSLDFKDVLLAQLPKSGAAAASGATAPPAVIAQGGAPNPGVAPPSTMPGFPGAAQPGGNPHQKEIGRLMDQAAKTNNPEEQVKIYSKVLELDPSSMVAYQGRKDAQDKVDKMRAEQAQRDAEQARQQEAQKEQAARTQANESSKNDALKQTEEAFLAGNFAAAASKLAIAKRIAPNDPDVLGWDARIRKETRTTRLTTYLLYGAALLVPGGLLALLILSRGKKDAYLEVVDGIDLGKRYKLDQEIIRIGAVEQDGGNKNEVVVRDMEHTISRFHCEIHRHDGKLYALDCNSANGTYLDGKRVPPGTPIRLKSGSKLELAKACTLRLGFEKRKTGKA